MRRGSILQLLGLAVLFGAAAVAVAVFIPWLPPVASRERHRIDIVFWLATIICIGIFTIVASVIAYSVLKFRRQPEDDSDGPPIHGHTGLEIFWTAVPAVLVTAIAIVSSIVLVKNGRAGPNPLRVQVTAEQFVWKFTYCTPLTSSACFADSMGNPPASATQSFTSPILYLPLGQSVKLNLIALDVIHSFWVPEFGQKQDAVPGTTQHLVITPTRDGTYPVICTELCGLGHATMRTQAVVLEPAAFTKWVDQQKGPTSSPAAGTGSASSPSTQGKALFTQQGCSACHTLTAAGATGKVGPDLDKLAQEAQRAGQPLEAFVRESIVSPNAYIEPGFPKGVMPQNFGTSIPSAQLNALVSYLVQSAKGAK